jgi:hypothetical protein
LFQNKLPHPDLSSREVLNAKRSNRNTSSIVKIARYIFMEIQFDGGTYEAVKPPWPIIRRDNRASINVNGTKPLAAFAIRLI